MAFIWGQFHKRYLSNHSLKLAWKLPKLISNLPGASELKWAVSNYNKVRTCVCISWYILWYLIWNFSTDHNEILRMSQHLHCCNMSKISLWWDEYVMNKSITKFHWILKFIEILLVGWPLLWQLAKAKWHITCMPQCNAPEQTLQKA